MSNVAQSLHERLSQAQAALEREQRLGEEAAQEIFVARASESYHQRQDEMHEATIADLMQRVEFMRVERDFRERLQSRQDSRMLELQRQLESTSTHHSRQDGALRKRLLELEQKLSNVKNAQVCTDQRVHAHEHQIVTLEQTSKMKNGTDVVELERSLRKLRKIEDMLVSLIGQKQHGGLQDSNINHVDHDVSRDVHQTIDGRQQHKAVPNNHINHIGRDVGRDVHQTSDGRQQHKALLNNHINHVGRDVGRDVHQTVHDRSLDSDLQSHHANHVGRDMHPSFIDERSGQRQTLGQIEGKANLKDDHVAVVSILSATGLRDADHMLGQGVSDPYCVCEVMSEAGRKRKSKFQTKVVSDNCSPVWNHPGEAVNVEAGDVLVFTVWDKDPGLRDDFLGEVSLPVAGVLDQESFSEPLTLTDKKKKPCGSLAVSIRVPRLLAKEDTPRRQVSSSCGSPRSQHSRSGSKQSKASASEYNHDARSSERVLLLERQLEEQKRQAEQMQREHAAKEREHAAKEAASQQKIEDLRLQLEERKRHSGENDSVNSGNRFSGRISKATASATTVSRTSMASATRGSGELSTSISIVGARGLRNADHMFGQGISDPYCVCSVEGKPKVRCKTEVASDTLDPVWNLEGEVLNCDPSDTLEFTVWDKDIGKADDFLGKVTVPLAHVMERTYFDEDKLPLTDSKGKWCGSLHVKINLSHLQEETYSEKHHASAPKNAPTRTFQAPDASVIFDEFESSPKHRKSRPTTPSNSRPITPASKGMARSRRSSVGSADDRKTTTRRNASPLPNVDRREIGFESSISNSPQSGQDARRESFLNSPQGGQDAKWETLSKSQRIDQNAGRESACEKVEEDITVIISIFSASGLRNADHMVGQGVSDPYCVCEVIGKPKCKFETCTVSDKLDPVWNHQGEKFQVSADDIIAFTVWDSDVGKSDDHLGEVHVSMRDVISQGGLSSKTELLDKKKKPCGTIRVKIILPHLLARQDLQDSERHDDDEAEPDASLHNKASEDVNQVDLQQPIVKYAGFTEHAYRLLFAYEDKVPKGQYHLITIVGGENTQLTKENDKILELREGNALFCYPFPQHTKVELAGEFMDTPFVFERPSDHTIAHVQTWPTKFTEDFKRNFKIQERNPNTEKFEPQAVEDFKRAMVKLFRHDEKSVGESVSVEKEFTRLGVPLRFCTRSSENDHSVYVGIADDLLDFLGKHPDVVEEKRIVLKEGGILSRCVDKSGKSEFTKEFNFAPGTRYVLYTKLGNTTMACITPLHQFIRDRCFYSQVPLEGERREEINLHHADFECF